MYFMSTLRAEAREAKGRRPHIPLLKTNSVVVLVVVVVAVTKVAVMKRKRKMEAEKERLV